MEKQNLPNATTSLVLGILSLVTCICYGIIGLPLGIIALVLGNKAIKEYNLNPENYNSVGNATAGKITRNYRYHLKRNFFIGNCMVLLPNRFSNFRRSSLIRTKNK
ncbi:CCC motif membrane protein [Polaribacter sejongensis]|uniref:CCC motif membrane protein n=1 Tax=Polaribacter sejongensis TaxID=985043 RepID=UPI0035A5E473